ncbi:MAG TPA: YgaP-like transmembrane domain [Vicinamibacterales bacterium]|jgi:glutaredoxin|nr:YgaP-like transmembrane domain [Vicinamibacterales bacterium]
MIIVYGADWCEDTRRSLRHLRRLGVAHQYVNIDEDAEGLARALALNSNVRRTPTIDLGVGGGALVEPENDTLTGALVEMEMLAQEEVRERLSIQNVGDTERVIRAGVGLAILLAARAAPRVLKLPLRTAGAVAALTGLSGWCPAYHARRVTSLNGPGDHPDEAERTEWLAAR